MKLKFYQISLVSLIILFVACSEKRVSDYSRHSEGFWHKLLAFKEDDCSIPATASIIKLNAEFKTQNDSVFYDSNNNLNNRYYFQFNGADSSNLIVKACAGKCTGDSIELLIPTKVFYEQNFKLGRVPYFSLNDSIVKVQFGISGFFDRMPESSKLELVNLEKRRILNYFGSTEQMNVNKSSDGFYWVTAPKALKMNLHKDSVLIISYKGYFLNGRQMDASPNDFKFVPGTPDQFLKGLNIVINYLKRGENAKIILPSHLAFGEKGLIDLNIPPFTPLLYEITIK